MSGGGGDWRKEILFIFIFFFKMAEAQARPYSPPETRRTQYRVPAAGGVVMVRIAITLRCQMLCNNAVLSKLFAATLTSHYNGARKISIENAIRTNPGSESSLRIQMRTVDRGGGGGSGEGPNLATAHRRTVLSSLPRRLNLMVDGSFVRLCNDTHNSSDLCFMLH